MKAVYFCFFLSLLIADASELTADTKKTYSYILSKYDDLLDSCLNVRSFSYHDRLANLSFNLGEESRLELVAVKNNSFLFYIIAEIGADGADHSKEFMIKVETFFSPKKKHRLF
jgi:hypothetical protein